MNELAIINSLFKRQTIYIPVIAKATGSIKLAILWSQIHYWKDKTKDPDGWIYKSREELFDELALSRTETEGCRDLGIKTGILESMVRGTPPIVHFRVNMERTIELIRDYLKKYPEENIIGKIQKTEKELKLYNSIEWLKKIPETDIKEMMEKYSVEKRMVLSNAENVIIYCESKGRKYSNYKAALMNFIKLDIERHPEKKRNVRYPVKEALRESSSEDPREKRTPEEQASIEKNLGKIKDAIVDKFKIKS